MASSEDLRFSSSPISSLPKGTMRTKLSLTESLTLSAVAFGCLAVLGKTVLELDHEDPVYASLALSGIGFVASYALIRWCGNAFMRVGFKGKDMNKAKSIEM